MQEQGIAGFEVTGWYALIAPAGTPQDVTQRLSREITRWAAVVKSTGARID